MKAVLHYRVLCRFAHFTQATGWSYMYTSIPDRVYVSAKIFFFRISVLVKYHGL